VRRLAVVVWVGTVLALGAYVSYGASWTTTQLTDNSYDDAHPQVSGSNVAWRMDDGNDYETSRRRSLPRPCRSLPH